MFYSYLMAQTEIFTADDLNNVRNNLTGSYSLMNDIDLSTACSEGGDYYNEGAGWIPIGDYVETNETEDSTYAFQGTFNGNGHKITGLKCNKNSYAGLFGSVYNATISYLGVSGTINGFDQITENSGIFAGKVKKSNIEFCFSEGTIIGGGNIGGLAGFIEVNTYIYNCFSTATVQGSYYYGVLVGNAGLYTYFKNCYSKGHLSIRTGAETNSDGGGFIGNNVGQIRKCYSASVVSGLNNGAFIGSNMAIKIYDCFYDYDVTVIKDESNYNDATYPTSNNISGVTPKTTAEMKDVATFTSLATEGLEDAWDFYDDPYDDGDPYEYWDISSSINNGYPYITEINYTPETLPVTLSSFTAICNNSNTVSLQWITQSETGILGYHVYRSKSNQINSAERVSFNLIPSQNSSSETQYSFIDHDTDFEQTYSYWLESIEQNGVTEFFGPIQVTTKSDEETPLPSQTLKTCLIKTWPNPFNPSTSLSYQLSEPAQVKIEVFNSKGQLVTVLKNQYLQAGNHNVIWNGKDHYKNDCSSGLYYFRMTAGKTIDLKKALLIK